MNIANDIKCIGVNDREIRLFEAQFTTPNGMAYNSYAIIDEKIAVIDGVEKGFTAEWLDNIENALEGKAPDYFLVQHMEPDHSSSIMAFAEKYPDATVVSSAKAFGMMKTFYDADFSDRQLTVTDGSELNLGKHTLKFIAAPMVHWPEVIMTYDCTDNVLFSADGFGKFGTTDTDEDWACEARRYYFGIVGKYGAQVQSVLKKVTGLDIKAICPLHGPVLTENVGYYINLYDIWSSYRPESEGVVIAYTSVYGHTEKAAELLKEKLIAEGCKKVAVTNLVTDDMAEAVEDAFRYPTLVLASTTYNAGVFPKMKEFIDHLVERNYQNRTIALIENGSWAPMAAKTMKLMFEKSKDIVFSDTEVKIISALDQDSTAKIEELAKELCK